MLFKNWKDFLWPLGGTLLGLLVMPIAIAQYPRFFGENVWLLPASVLAVVLCWIIPLLLHDRTRTIYSFVIAAVPRYGHVLFACACLVVIVLLILGSMKLFRIHSRHLEESIAASKEPPALAVDIEHRIFTLPGPYGTGFWFGSFGFSSCSLEPTEAAIFLRITNSQRHKEMITAYSINGWPKIQVPHGRMFPILPKGQIGNGFVPQAIDFRAPAGMGALVRFPVDDADTSKAIPVTGDFLDYKIGEGHYLEPDESVRGWVFFEYRKGYMEVPAHLTIKVRDQFQHSFTYPILDHVGDPEGDILTRRIVEGPLEDLSRCVVYK